MTWASPHPAKLKVQNAQVSPKMGMHRHQPRRAGAATCSADSARDSLPTGSARRPRARRACSMSNGDVQLDAEMQGALPPAFSHVCLWLQVLAPALGPAGSVANGEVDLNI